MIVKCWWFWIGLMRECGNGMWCTYIRFKHVKYGVDASRLTYSQYFEMTNNTIDLYSYNEQKKFSLLTIINTLQCIRLLFLQPGTVSSTHGNYQICLFVNILDRLRCIFVHGHEIIQFQIYQSGINQYIVGWCF